MSDFATLAGVRALFSNNVAVLLGWVRRNFVAGSVHFLTPPLFPIQIHYAAFDLLVGRWILNDSKRENIKHWFVAPCLFLTMMFGPLGFLSYVGLKTYHTRSLKWDQTATHYHCFLVCIIHRIIIKTVVKFDPGSQGTKLSVGSSMFISTSFHAKK